MRELGATGEGHPGQEVTPVFLDEDSGCVAGRARGFFIPGFVMYIRPVYEEKMGVSSASSSRPINTIGTLSSSSQRWGS